MKIILWIIFTMLVLIMGYQNSRLCASGADIFKLELAGRDEGTAILEKWKATMDGDESLLALAIANTRMDFAFIACYLALVVAMSNWQMQREEQLMLNEMLRFNIFAITSAGILDLIENLRLLHNMHHAGSVAEYWGTQYISLVKFVLIGLTILVFVVSWIKTVLDKGG